MKQVEHIENKKPRITRSAQSGNCRVSGLAGTEPRKDLYIDKNICTARNDEAPISV